MAISYETADGKKEMMEKEVKILKALASRRRLEILKLLRENYTMGLSEIATEIDLSYRSTSRHLLSLSNVDLIKQNRKGAWMIYNLNREVERLLGDIAGFKDKG